MDRAGRASNAAQSTGRNHGMILSRIGPTLLGSPNFGPPMWMPPRTQLTGRESSGASCGRCPVWVPLFITVLLMCLASSGGAQSLESEVRYSARDSIRYDLKQRSVLLYGAARVTYEDIELTADHIEYRYENEEVTAFGVPDTTGKVVGKPNFSQGGHLIEADSIRFSFRTRKGMIHEVRTNEQESYVQAKLSKRHANNEVHSKGGLLTTCDRAKPHYHFRASRMIVMPDDKIIAGPAIMKVGKVPTPLVIPFGLFPNKKGGTSGILVPTYGDNDQLGFFLLNGGYYALINDHVDVQLTGDIYSRGSWALRSLTRYRTRYRFNGSLDLSHSTQLNSDPEFPDFSRLRNYFIRWNHQVDPKASLTNRFSASVNVGTSQNFTNNFNSNTYDYLSNTFQSNVAWNRLWPGKPYTLAVNLRHSQNTLNRTFDLTLPSVVFNLTRVFPFTSKTRIGDRWYDRIGVNYTLNFDNLLRTTEDQLSFDNIPFLWDQFRNGIRHTAAMSTSFKTRFFTINPEIRVVDRMYFEQLRKTVFTEADTIFTVTDTISRFAAPFEWSAGATLTSKIYGMYQFRGRNLRAIRHVITPSVNFNYRPDQSTQIEGPFGINGATSSYSPYDIGIYGKPSAGASGTVNLGLIQSLEAKVRDRKADEDAKDPYKKMKLLDFVGLTSGYDLLKDSVQWSPVNLSARTTFMDRINVNFVSNWDPYAVDSLGQRIDRSQLKENGSLARLTNLNAAIGFSLKSKRYGQPAAGPQDDTVVEETDPSKGAFANFSLPWSLNVNYSYDLFRSYLNGGTEDQVRQSVLFNGDVNILRHWKLGFSSGYDLVAEEWTPTSLNLYWDLHCWEFNFNIIPLGIRKSFSVRINVKASILKDLKLEQRRPYGNSNDLLF
ncbi:MAG: LPS-assembly protein LptD [Flavobacteriales bacterium]|nr:LPS-assembly protein LptD [Flavobacteriales bacterium]